MSKLQEKIYKTLINAVDRFARPALHEAGTREIIRTRLVVICAMAIFVMSIPVLASDIVRAIDELSRREAVASNIYSFVLMVTVPLNGLIVLALVRLKGDSYLGGWFLSAGLFMSLTPTILMGNGIFSASLFVVIAMPVLFAFCVSERVADYVMCFVVLLILGLVYLHQADLIVSQSPFSPMKDITHAACAIATSLSLFMAIKGMLALYENTIGEAEGAREAAEAASLSKSAFLANTSHEVRTPLNGILGMALALQQDELRPQTREKVDEIIESGRNLLGILNDILDLSKIEAGRLEISPMNENLESALTRVYKLWLPTAEEKGLSLSLEMSDAAKGNYRFDPLRMRQCVSNLVSNAIKFTEKGYVRIEVDVADGMKADEAEITVKVSDSGIGMPPEVLNRLFKPFTQAEGTISRKFGGTGLGLSISQSMARLMGGDVRAQSTEGEGSVFSFTFLARREKASVAARVDDTREHPVQLDLLGRLLGPSAHVLLVDDNPVNRKVVQLFLQTLGPKVTEAQNGAEALEILEKDRFDLILLDMHMPEMDGPTTIAEIRSTTEEWREIPVIALTADAMSGDRERYLNMGMDGYASKPIDSTELFSELARVMTTAKDRAA